MGLEDPTDIRDDLSRVLEVVRAASKRAGASADAASVAASGADVDAATREAVARESAESTGSIKKESRHAV